MELYSTIENKVRYAASRVVRAEVCKVQNAIFAMLKEAGIDAGAEVLEFCNKLEQTWEDQVVAKRLNEIATKIVNQPIE